MLYRACSAIAWLKWSYLGSSDVFNLNSANTKITEPKVLTLPLLPVTSVSRLLPPKAWNLNCFYSPLNTGFAGFEGIYCTRLRCWCCSLWGWPLHILDCVPQHKYRCFTIFLVFIFSSQCWSLWILWTKKGTIRFSWADICTGYPKTGSIPHLLDE